MLLGIDASRATSPQPTGTEFYSRALIRALIQTQSSIRFRLYTRHSPATEAFPPANNYTVRTIPFPRLWTHIRLSWEMLTMPPDVLFVPAHVIPLVHPKRSIVTVHDLGYRFFPDAHSPWERLYLDLSTRWNATVSQVIIADSEWTRRDLNKVYEIPLGKIKVVYPAWNDALFNRRNAVERVGPVRTRYNLSSDYILAVGTRHPRKNFARLVEATARLPANIALVIAGKKGWRYDEDERRVNALGMNNRVRFLDYVPAEDLPGLYAGARLAVIPSLYEGFGFPVLEAQACGTPLACSNASSLPEAAGQGAAYFDPLDVVEMTRAIKDLLDNPNRRQALIAEGETNLRRFSWQRAAQQFLEIVTTLS